MRLKMPIAMFGVVIAGCFARDAALAEFIPAKLPDYDQVKAELWAREKASLAENGTGGRARPAATRSPYFKTIPSVWSSHPEIPAVPEGNQGLVEEAFVNMAYNGQTAVMMFTSHRMRLDDGTAVNQYFENTDVWSKKDEKWMLLASRSQPVQPPGQ